MGDKAIKNVLIAGGGPAGASTAILLARQGIQVTLIEKDFFPRQKLCGEFITPECFDHFTGLGVFEELLSSGGNRIAETAFYTVGGRSISIASGWLTQDHKFALGLSRAEMDRILLNRARAEGVDVREGTTAVRLIESGNSVCGLVVQGRQKVETELTADLVVDATGRGGTLTRMLAKKSGARQPRSEYVGFKAHLNSSEVDPAHCEIYFFKGGYAGLNLVENGVSNLCMLIRADAARRYKGNTGRIISELVLSNQRAVKTLTNLEPVDGGWLSVAVNKFGTKNLDPAPGLIAVGDAGAFIDPFTGSGILLALESAELLAKAVLLSPNGHAVAELYSKIHSHAFRRRLMLCRVMRRASFSPRLAGFVMAGLGRSETVRKYLSRATR